MFKHKKLTIWILAIVAAIVAVVFILGAVLTSSGLNPLVKPTAAPPKVTTPLVPEFESGSEAANAASIFGELSATDNFTKEEVQLAVYDAYAYTEKAFNDSYLISGEWQKDGYPRSHVEDQLSRYYSLDAWADIASKLDTIEANNDKIEVQAPLLREIISTMLFTDFRNVSLLPYTPCVTSTLQSCVYDGAPSYSDWSYTDATDPNLLIVTTTVTTPVIYQKEDGTEGVTEYKHTISFTMTANEYVDEALNQPSYVINGTDSTYEVAGWKEKAVN